MNNFTGLVEQHFWLLWSICAGWVALVTAASVVYRLKNGKKVFNFGDSSALFSERAASGRSCRSLVTRLAGANNCLTVTVTEQAITVSPLFPFNLMFLPELYDLEHRIPRGSVIQARRLRRFFTDWVEIEYRDGSGGSSTIQLHLRNRDAFLRAAGFDHLL